MSATAISSGIKTSGATQVYVGKGILSGATAISDSTNIATVIVYDNNDGSTTGNVLAKINATVNTGSNCLTLATPVRCDYGITISVTGVGTPQGIVYYGA